MASLHLCLSFNAWYLTSNCEISPFHDLIRYCQNRLLNNTIDQTADIYMKSLFIQHFHVYEFGDY